MTAGGASDEPTANPDGADAGRRMLGAVPGQEAKGRGPAGGDEPERRDYRHPAAGWGAAVSVARVVVRTGEPVDGPRPSSR